MATLYFSFIFVVAFHPAILARPVSSGSVVSLGVVCGVGLMVSGLVLTGIYAAYASKRLDALTTQLLKDFK